MKKQFIKILANILAIYLGSQLLTEMSILSASTAITAGFVLWLVNIIIRPFLVLITIPINILTLGLFSLVINTLMVMLVAGVIDGLIIDGFTTAFCLAIIIVIVNVILEKSLK